MIFVSVYPVLLFPATCAAVGIVTLSPTLPASEMVRLGVKPSPLLAVWSTVVVAGVAGAVMMSFWVTVSYPEAV